MTPSPGGAGPERDGPVPSPALRTLVVCDLVDSTALVERLGDREATDLFRQHDRVGRALLELHGGREIDKTDGFLLLFERPAQGLAFALDYQRALRDLAQRSGAPLRARVGIHVGDVLIFENAPEDVARGAKPLDVEGLVKPVTARLMSLALPGQILLSGTAHGLVQRAERELAQNAPGLAFRHHGRYAFKGLPEAMPVWAVGQAGLAPLQRPPSSDKAWRYVPWWRRPRVLLAELAGLASVAALVAWLTLSTAPAIAFSERDWVVVGDLRNVTGQTVFDESIETALRISLEQSRFVNVMPDLQVRDALRRMRKPPDAALDRAVAAEVAIREGARAVLLPTIAESGGRLRVSVEVVDPQSQATVHAELADGKGAESALPSVDAVARALRRRLGESLAQVEQSSLPLEKVTTPNLDALKAYSQAQLRIQQGDFDGALDLLAFATELDPRFAAAHARTGSLLYSLERFRDAKAALDRAAGLQGRLTQREELYIRAQLARFAGADGMIALWLRYAAVYPDAAAGQNNAGNLLYMLHNDYDAAERQLAAVVALGHPLRNLSLHAMGHVRLADGRVDDAIRAWRRAAELSPAAMYFGLSDGLAARGEHADAAKYLDDAPRQSPTMEIERRLRRVTLLADQGRFADARAAAVVAAGDAAQLPFVSATWRVRAADAALVAATGDAGGARAAYADLVRSVLAAIDADPLADLEAPEHALHAALLATRLGATDVGAAVLARAWPSGFPVREQLMLALRAEVALAAAADDATAQAALADALRRLEALLDGRESWHVRETLARAHASLGATAASLAHLDWLAGHRGRAFAEWVAHEAGQTGRVVAWNAARLEQAQARAALGRADAGDAAAAFLGKWNGAEESPLRAEAETLAARGKGFQREGTGKAESAVDQ